MTAWMTAEQTATSPLAKEPRFYGMVREVPVSLNDAHPSKLSDILTVQELSVHADDRTTMIYTHVLNRGPSGVRSPVDGL